ncbi:hypothetical protein M5689_007456 [Euphorbia peplus]|nr:hypothetical protein M5689_007456 [Euphorbia peplus]
MIITSESVKLDAAEIAKSAKHKISFSSSSSSNSIDIEKNQIVAETKHFEQENDQVLVAEPEINPKHKENPSISRQGSTAAMLVQQGGAYDPNRIPASVFTSKAGTPMEWSCASNESLFSIHMGNTSFSRDHVFMLYRSGEMPKFDFDQSMNLFSGTNTPPIPPEYIDRKSMEIPKFNSDYMMPQPELPAPNTMSTPLDHEKIEKIVFADKNISVHGDEIRTSCSSTHSFQFPLLEIGGASMKGTADNMHSPRRPSDAHRMKSLPKAQAQPQAASAAPKRSSWTSYFSCCAPPAN